MIGKVLACSVLGGTTLAVYMVVFNDPQPYPIAPPLKPLHIMTNTPTTTTGPNWQEWCATHHDSSGGQGSECGSPTTIPSLTPLPSVTPDPTVGGMLCPRTSPKKDGTCTLQDWGLPNDPPTTTPTFVPAHPGEIIV